MVYNLKYKKSIGFIRQWKTQKWEKSAKVLLSIVLEIPCAL